MTAHQLNGAHRLRSTSRRRRRADTQPGRAQLDLRTLTHGDFKLCEGDAANFILIVFHRGLHCPICLKYPPELGRLQPDFDKRGVKVSAVSSNGRERTQAMADKLKAAGLRMGCDPGLANARDFALAKNYPARSEYIGAV
jgi:peroxiredoxin